MSLPTPTLTVDWRDGWLCIKHTDTSFVEPIIISNWWPVEACPRTFAEDLIGRPAVRISDGIYGARANDLGRLWKELRLRDGARTMPIHTETIPIPCPKVRASIETRYRDGRWQKYLVTRGWVDA